MVEEIVDMNKTNVDDVNDEDLIRARLNELRLWQESQRKLLAESQLDQQKMLELEKVKLYDLFGLSANDSSLQDIAESSTELSVVIQNHEPLIDIHKVANLYEQTPLNESNSHTKLQQKSLELHSPSINQLQKIIENMANRSPRHAIVQTEHIPKRPYLKRGEGLKNRFNIAPDAFRLDKLPKYKYAQRMQKHAQSQQLRKQRHQQENTTNDTAASTVASNAGVAATFEGHQNNANDDNRRNNEKKQNMKVGTKRPNPRTTQLKLKPNTTKQNKVTPSSSSSSSSLSKQSNDVNKCLQGK